MCIVMKLNGKCRHLLAGIKGYTFENTQSVDLSCYHRIPEWKMYEYAQSVNSFPGNTSATTRAGFRASEQP